MDIEKVLDNRKQLIFARLNPETIDALADLSKQTGIKRSTLMRMIVESALREGVRVVERRPDDEQSDPDDEPETAPKPRRRAAAPPT